MDAYYKAITNQEEIYEEIEEELGMILQSGDPSPLQKRFQSTTRVRG